uniref:Uncharacterized protein n=1 Tax=Meloidogyne javanica TaxID=6303 RepID=A0A915LHA6_MELJA
FNDYIDYEIMGFEIMGCRKHIEQHYLLIIEECVTESNWTINEYLQAMDAIPNIAATNARAH